MELLRLIPGFRTGVKWKMVIASIYYLFCAASVLGGISLLLFMLSLPLIFFSFIGVFKNRKLFKASTKGKGTERIAVNKAILKLIFSLILCIVSLSTMPPAENTNTSVNTDSNVAAAKNKVDSETKQGAESNEKEKDNTVDSNKNGELESDSVKNSGNEDKTESKPNTGVGSELNEGGLKVHYIDVGQADAILIQQGSHSMLIDAGNNADSNLVKNYLSNQGITKLDYVIGTHPHEDHIGGLDYVINAFKIGKIYMPKATSNTKTFEDVVIAIKNKGMKATAPTPGAKFNLGDAQCTILAPNNSTYEDTNDYSIVLKIQYGNNSFLFTGDAEAISEMEMVKKGFDLKSDVLKVGHHGSYSSTSANFLTAVNPKYAVISVGEDNKYGHPNKGTMDRLRSKNIPVYRTDENGTIIATSNGKSISFNVKPGDYSYRSTDNSTNSGSYSNNDSSNKPSSTNSTTTQSKQTTTNTTSSTTGNKANTTTTESKSSLPNGSIDSNKQSIFISNIDKGGEIVIVTNNSSKDINLTGWSIISVTGNQSFTFPSYVLKAGSSVKVASGDNPGDLQWGKGNIWNNSKSDPGELFDANGNLVFRYND